MASDTITIDRLADALAALELATQGVANLLRDAKAGITAPAEAAADLREIAQNVNAALA